MSSYTPDPRSIRPVLVAAALICLLGVLHAAPEPAAISRVVVTVPAVLADDGASTRGITRQLLDLCKAAPGTLEDRLRSAGGEWRLLETPVAAHLVMLFPQAASEAESLLTGLAAAIQANLRRPPTGPDRVTLQERLLGAAIETYRGPEAQPSLWIDGPLASSQDRIEALFVPTASGETPTPAPNGDMLVHPGSLPAVARLLIWEPSTPSAHFTARYLGEAFSNLPNLPQGGTAFDLWDLPTRTFLVLLASAPLHELEHRERIIDSFIRDKCASSTHDPRWISFASASLELIALDRRDLAKSALISALATRNRWNIAPPVTLKNLRPTSIRSFTILPDASWANLFQEQGPTLRLIAATIPASSGSTNIVDAVLLIRPLPSHAQATIDTIHRLLDEDVIPSAQLLADSPTELQLSMSLPLAELTTALTTIRSRLSAYFQSSPANPAGTATLAVVGNGIPPYRIVGRVHEAWPMGEQPAQQTSQQLTAELVKALLSAPTAGNQELRGRWTLCAASQNTLAAFLARLAAADVTIRSLNEIDRLLIQP
ncbi:MAG TPA: hypothetical protein VIV61_12910 [Candidatus Ozemobacteraceae bacterium]